MPLFHTNFYSCNVISVILGLMHLSSLNSVMVNCMRQLDCAMACRNIWSNIILGVSVRVFLDAINI